MVLTRAALGLLALLLLNGCNISQSALHPAGPHAGCVNTLGWVMFVGGAFIFLLVVVLIALALFVPPERRRWMTRRSFIVGLGIVFPVVTLTALLIYGFTVAHGLVRPGEALLRVEVVGKMWWWRVHYVDERGEPRLVSANEIRVPTGRPVEFILKTEDVIHSFWVPSLAGKLDMIPGRTNVYRFAADRPGIYRGQCAEFCGEQHALMAFHVIAMEPDAFEAWYAAEMRPAVEPATPQAVQGRDLFLRNGCGACHVVRGTEANGLQGPDLTHIGSRQTIAAGTYPNNVGTLAGWISSAQHLKPGNAMPSFGNLSGEDLRAIAAYMESLK